MRDSRIIENGGYYYEYALSVSSTLDKVIREKSKIATGNDGYRVVRVVEEAQRFISMVR